MLKKSDISQAAAAADGTTFVIGQALFIRTLSFHHTGRLVRISQCGETTFLHMSEAAWIAEDGRFMDCIEKGTINEVEPVTVEMCVNVAHIVDWFPWNHPLPRQQK